MFLKSLQWEDETARTHGEVPAYDVRVSEPEGDGEGDTKEKEPTVKLNIHGEAIVMHWFRQNVERYAF